MKKGPFQINAKRPIAQEIMLRYYFKKIRPCPIRKKKKNKLHFVSGKYLIINLR